MRTVGMGPLSPAETAAPRFAPKFSSALGPLSGGGGAMVDSRAGAKAGVSTTTRSGRLRWVTSEWGALEDEEAEVEGARPQLGDMTE
ncbi:MAG: hypothetical protein WDW38_002973 [Sanguina aurantia]